MKKVFFISGFVFFSCVAVHAGDGDYAVSKIPASLIKGANAVIRFEEQKLEIKNSGETILKNQVVITILNENGNRWADFAEYYSRHRHIESIEGILYDAAGKQIKRIKKKDVEDLSGVSDISLIDDNRIRHHNFYYKVYPYTVEYTVEINNKSTLFFPGWTPQGGEYLSVENSSVTIISPLNYTFRYKAFKYDREPVVTTQKENKIYTWSVTNLPAITRDRFSPLWHELTTRVIFGPTEFQIDDYKGNMATWQDFGKFVYSLKAGRDVLPDQIRQTVHQLTDGLIEPKEKITRLYEYMQKHTRYISIQLGIGGWQPFDATYVATRGYGDCKALTNYMYSLLKEIGIKSYYALIRAGSNETYLTDDFPSQQFNHVILCVPVPQSDTVWLECTSQTMQAGYLGEFTSNRLSLLIDETGGKLVRTPKYGKNDNRQTRNIKAELDGEGTMTINAASRYTGIQQDDLHSIINQLTKEKVKEQLNKQLDFSTYEINQFDYKELKSSVPAITETLNILVSNYATITGKRLFIVPNIMTRAGSKLSQDSVRKFDIQLYNEYKDVDTVEIEVPNGYQIEAMPQPFVINSKFGNYSSTVLLKDSKLFYYRSLEHNSGRFPAKYYNELASFYEAIYKADRSRVVLVKK